MSFPFDSVAALTARIRELDEPAQRLPAIQPVGVVADYTRRASTEPIEVRGFAAWAQPSDANFAFAQVHAPVRPVVLDLIAIKVSNGAASLGLFIGNPQFVDPPLGTRTFVNLGGVAATAMLDGTSTPIGSAGAIQIPLEQNVVQQVPTGGALRALIPLGRTLSLKVSLTNVATEWGLVFREIIG